MVDSVNSPLKLIARPPCPNLPGLLLQQHIFVFLQLSIRLFLLMPRPAVRFPDLRDLQLWLGASWRRHVILKVLDTLRFRDLSDDDFVLRGLRHGHGTCGIIPHADFPWTEGVLGSGESDASEADNDTPENEPDERLHTELFLMEGWWWEQLSSVDEVG